MFTPLQKVCVSIAILTLSPFGLSTVVSAQSTPTTHKTVEDLPIQYTDTGVVKAQYIRPGDVSVAEHNRLLAEAARVRMFQSQNRLPNTYTGGSYDAANAQETQTGITSTSVPVGYDTSLVQATMGPSIVKATSIKARYYVVKGDTLYNISKRHGVDIADIQHANGLEDHMIRQGQTLDIPIIVQYVPSKGVGTQPTYNTVRTTPKFVKTVEPVPVQLASTAQPQVYAVLPGDTLYSIAQRVCTTPQALQTANAISDPGGLQPGQYLEMPAEHCLN